LKAIDDQLEEALRDLNAKLLPNHGQAGLVGHVLIGPSLADGPN
jgi:hypothetical protein